MEHSELEGIVLGLHQLAMAQAGVNAAQRVLLDALLSAIGGSLSPILDATSDTLNTLEGLVRRDLEPGSIQAFDNSIAEINNKLRVMRGT